MNKKTIAFISLFFLISSLIIAQDEVNVYWGKDNPLVKKSAIHLLGRRGDVLLGYNQVGKNISIVTYSFSDLQVNGEIPIIGGHAEENGGMIPKDYAFDQILLLKNKNYVCVTQFDKSTKQTSLYMEELDNTGRLQGGVKKIVSMSAISKRNRGTFDIIISKDSSKFLIVNIPAYEKYNGEKFGFQVYDESLNVLDNAQVSLPNNFKYFVVDNNDISLSNDGMVYMMAKIIQKKSDNAKGESAYYYELLSIDPHGTGEVNTYDLKLQGKAITDISYMLEEGKYVICSGFYGNVKGNSGSTGEIDGIFYFRLNKETKELESIGTKVLDRDFVADLTTQKKANKGKGISNNFTLVDFAKRSDGGAVLVSEYRDFYVSVITTPTSNGGTTTQYVQNYIRNNIIVININPDGTIKWYANIPKLQHTTDDGGDYSSFLMATRGDEMYFIYNDNAANMDPKKPLEDDKLKTMENRNVSVAVLVELSESGQFTKSLLFSNKENKVVIQPAKSVKISDNEYVTPAIGKNGKCCCFISTAPKKYKLARLEFK